MFTTALNTYREFMYEHGYNVNEVYLVLLAVALGGLAFISVDIVTALFAFVTSYIVPKYGMVIWSWYSSHRASQRVVMKDIQDDK